MKKSTLLICTAALLFAACNNEKTSGETTEKTTDSVSKAADVKTETYVMPDSATMMKNWQEYSTPGEAHKMMASWDGNWNADISMWYAPGTPPEVSKSTAINKTIMDGRYQVSNVKGNMMGMPFEGMSVLGYDNAKKIFINTWIDNFGTGMMKLEGSWDEASKSLLLKGKCVDPSAGNGRETDVRQVLKIIDADNHLLEMFGPGPDGKEFKMMEAKYTRKK